MHRPPTRPRAALTRAAHRVPMPLCAFLLATAAAAQAPGARPIALENVKLSDSATAPSVVVVLRAGRIESIANDKSSIPPDARVIDGHDLLLLPAFVDAYSHAGCPAPQPVAERDVPVKTNIDVQVDMRAANRKGIAPSYRAAEVFRLEKDTAKNYRESGFGSLLSAPHGQLLAGTSALATTRDAAPRDSLLRPVEFDHASFACPGPGYPGTLMGAHAQLRQFFLDAQRQRLLEERRAAGKTYARLPWDADLDAIRAALARHHRVVCEAETANDIERWIKLGDEFGFDIAISGGREAWKRADLLAQRKIPVFLTLEWGDEPEDPHKKDAQDKAEKKAEVKPGSGADASVAKTDTAKIDTAKTDTAKPDTAKPGASQTEAQKTVAPPSAGQDSTTSPPDVASGAASTVQAAAKADDWIYEAPLTAKEERRRRFEELRSGVLELSKKGVAFAFGSGSKSPKVLLDRVRSLVESGLPADVALRALTTSSAELLGVPQNLGKVEKGFDATLALWSKHPLSNKEAKLAWIFVDGYAFEFNLDDNALAGKPDDGVDATGTWTLEFDMPQAKPATAEFTMTVDGKVTGSIRYKSPSDDAEVAADFSGQVAGKQLKVSGSVKFGAFEAEVTIDGLLEGNGWKGTTRWKSSNFDDTRGFTGSRAPKEIER